MEMAGAATVTSNVAHAPLDALLAYVAATPPRPASEAVLVPKDSAIKTVTDLKGKKVAFNKGSNVHYFLVKLLEKHGLKYADVQPIFLPPADARAAFEKGSVDAWVIWDPFLAAAEHSLGARVLADAKGVVNNRSYYFSSLPYARQNPDVTKVLIEELSKLDAWGTANRDALAAEFAPLWGLPKPAVDRAVQRSVYGTGPITPAILQEQQAIADTFFDLKLIPKKIRLLDAAVGAGRAGRTPSVIRAVSGFTGFLRVLFFFVASGTRPAPGQTIVRVPCRKLRSLTYLMSSIRAREGDAGSDA